MNLVQHYCSHVPATAWTTDAARWGTIWPQLSALSVAPREGIGGRPLTDREIAAFHGVAAQFPALPIGVSYSPLSWPVNQAGGVGLLPGAAQSAAAQACLADQAQQMARIYAAAPALRNRVKLVMLDGEKTGWNTAVLTPAQLNVRAELWAACQTVAKACFSNALVCWYASAPHRDGWAISWSDEGQFHRLSDTYLEALGPELYTPADPLDEMMLLMEIAESGDQRPVVPWQALGGMYAAAPGVDSLLPPITWQAKDYPLTYDWQTAQALAQLHGQIEMPAVILWPPPEFADVQAERWLAHWQAYRQGWIDA